MASRIKGITIEIDGNTKPLEAALKSVNKDLGKTQSELRDVERLLKMDPGNTELLSQKQRLLQDAIEGTEKKLTSLKEASAQAAKQLASGELGQDKYDALQREIISTERSLESLKNRASATDAALSKSSSGLEKFGTAAGNAGSKLSGLSKGAGALLAATAATIPATQELNRDLSFLKQNAQAANIGVGAMEKGFKTFNAVTGETDSSVEAISNLLQAGFTESNLQTAIEGVSGAMSKFPDTLKIESLADSIQETVATGKSIGQFGEYLDRVGIGAANFDEELAGCNSQAEKTDLVLQALAKGGAQDAYKAWEKNNKSLKDYEDASLEMQMALTELANTIAPLASQLIKLGTKGVKAFNSLPKPVKVAAASMAGLAAATSPVLNGMSKITQIAPKIPGLISAMSNPYLLAASAAAALGVAIYAVVKAQNDEVKAAEEAGRKRQQSISNIEGEYAKADIYLNKLRELEGVENKSSAQKEQMAAIVEQLNGSVEGLNLTYDKEKDALSETTDALEQKIQKSKEAAIADAYMKNSEKALQDYADSTIKLTEAKNKLAEKEEKLSGFTVTTSKQYREAKKMYDTAKESVEELTEVTLTYWQEATRAANEAAMASGQWDTLVEDAKTAGISIPQSLTQGIREGQYEIPTTIEELKALMNFDSAIQAAGQDGAAMVQALQSEIAAGTITTAEATAILNGAVTGETGKLPGKMSQTSIDAVEKYARGINSGKTKAATAGKNVGKAAKSGAASVDGTSAGKNFSAGFAQGILNGLFGVKSAAETVAEKALAAAKRKSEVRSPSRRWDRELGQMDGAGFAKGLLRSVPLVKSAGAALSDAAIAGAKVNGQAMSNNMSTAVEQKVTWDYTQIYRGMEAAVNNMQFVIVMDQRELGRGLRGMGVQFA